MKDDDLLDEREAQAGAASLGGEEWTEHALAIDGRDAGTVVVHGDARHFARPIVLGLNDHVRPARRRRTGFERVPEQVAEGLAQKDFVAFENAEFTVDVDAAAKGARVGANFVRCPLADRFEVHGCQRELRRPGEVQEVGHDLTQRFGFCTDPLDVGAVRLGQRLQIEQLAVAQDGGETVPEFVRDAGGELADGCQAFLQPQLLFQILHRCEVGEQTNRPVLLFLLVEHRRDRDAEV